MVVNEPDVEYKLLASGDDETPPQAKAQGSRSKFKKPAIVFLCLLLEILHLLLIWGAYAAIQRAQHPKQPDLDGCKCTSLINMVLKS
jgi:hypothetical protein